VCPKIFGALEYFLKEMDFKTFNESTDKCIKKGNKNQFLNLCFEVKGFKAKFLMFKGLKSCGKFLFVAI
jgi:hypothetical protein